MSLERRHQAKSHWRCLFSVTISALFGSFFLHICFFVTTWYFAVLLLVLNNLLHNDMWILRGLWLVVKTSVTHSPAARVPLLCFYHILMSSVIYYWTDAPQHGIYSLNIIFKSNKIYDVENQSHTHWRRIHEDLALWAVLIFSSNLPKTPHRLTYFFHYFKI